MARSSRVIQDWKDWKYWKVQKYQTLLTPPKRHLMHVLTLSLIKNVPKQVVKFLVLWLTGSRVRQPLSEATTAFTRGVVSHCSGFFLSARQMDWGKTGRVCPEKKMKWDIMGDPMGFESELFVYLPQHLPWWVFKVFPVHKWALPRQGRCFAICQHPSGKLLA